MIGDLLLGVLRLTHALAAALWLGGTFVYAVAGTGTAPWPAFREALRVGIVIFIGTGAVLAADRLSSAALPPLYVALLVVKVALGVWMFAIARRFGRSVGASKWRRPEAQVLALGIAVYGIALGLRAMYEATIHV